MSELTFASITSTADLIWPEPALAVSGRMASALASALTIVRADVAHLVRASTDVRLSNSALMQSANVNINRRAVGIRSLAEQAASTESNQIRFPNLSPQLERAEMILARANACNLSKMHLEPLRAELRAVDLAIGRGRLDQAQLHTEAAARAAQRVEVESQTALAEQQSQASAVADRIARAGSVWTALSCDKGVKDWSYANHRREMDQAQELLRKGRNALAGGAYREALPLAEQAGAILETLMSAATQHIARSQRVSNAKAAEETLAALGFTASVIEGEDRSVVQAAKEGRVRFTISFDSEGRFEIDSLKGYHGSACSVEVNAVLKALAKRIGFEVEDRVYVGGPDEGRAAQARKSRSRRRPSAGAPANKSAQQEKDAALQAAACAAWSQIAR